MPLQVTIALNERELSTLTIARIAGGLDRQSEKVHTYEVTRTAKGKPPRIAKFTHRYGDPAEVCVTLALQALAASHEAPAPLLTFLTDGIAIEAESPEAAREACFRLYRFVPEEVTSVSPVASHS
jgi:hypothetical protein